MRTYYIAQEIALCWPEQDGSPKGGEIRICVADPFRGTMETKPAL